MWIQNFKIFKKTDIDGRKTLVEVSDDKYNSQREAFKWVDEKGNKEEQYVFLPEITFDPDAKS